jgi:hypothetical protein
MSLHRPTLADLQRPPPEAPPVDWTVWLRLIERKRRMLSRLSQSTMQLPRSLLARMTVVSFRMDDLPVTDAMATDAISGVPGHRPFRSRLTQRLRNHVAILRSVQRSLISGATLKVPSVVRWYTSLSCGLSTTRLDEATMDRLHTVIGRISSPRMRLQPAVQDVARLHTQLMLDPLVPSFNGILVRLLLHYHLGRCGFPPVLLDPIADRPRLTNESQLLPRLMDLIDASYSLLLAGNVMGPGPI